MVALLLGAAAGANKSPPRRDRLVRLEGILLILDKNYLPYPHSNNQKSFCFAFLIVLFILFLFCVVFDVDLFVIAPLGLVASHRHERTTEFILGIFRQTVRDGGLIINIIACGDHVIQTVFQLAQRYKFL